MNMTEYLKVKDYSYEEYCEYLKELHGKVLFKYGSSKNKKPGYFIHHIAEDTVPSLSHKDQKKQYPEYQVPELLVYCDYLEHLLLHIIIGRVTDPAKHLGLNGPCRYIIPNLINFYEHGIKQKINDLYYSMIEKDKDVFELLIAEYNNLVKDIDLVLEHNVSLYAQVEESLDINGKAHATLGTGLGKTTLALQYVKTHSCRALVVCPNNIVKDSWVGNGSWTVPVTYQTLASKYDPETDTLNFDLSSYNLVILDEVHHAGYDEESGKGALLWGKAIKKLFDSGIKILGLTATEIRSDGIDVSEQFFEGCNFEGYSFEKAIEEGIVHPISYVTAVYDWSDIDEELENLGVKVNHDPGYQKLRGQLDVVRNDTPELTTILRNSLRVPQSEMRGIAFIQDEKDEERVLSILRDAYPGALLLSINSHMDKKDVEKNKKLFADPETKNAILVAINMVTEGAHYRGINTGIMFRTTESWVLYAQMVGRFSVLTTYPNPNGVIIDLVNNLNRIKYNDRVKDAKKKPAAPRLKDITRKLAEKSDQVIYEDYTQDFVARMHELKEYCSEVWTEEELAWLANNATASKQELCEYLTRHSWIAIRGTAERLLDLDVRAKARAMPEQDLKVLKLHYEELGPDDILPLLSQHYKRSSVMNAANKLGLHWNGRKIHMLEEELDLIRVFYPTEGREGLFKRLNEKYSKVFIARTAKALGVQYKRLVHSELEAFIKDNYLVKTSEQMATELEISTGTISTVMKRLNLLSPHTNKNRVKKVRCIETNQVYPTVHQAVVTTGITSISYGLKNNKPAGGYHWEYVD